MNADRLQEGSDPNSLTILVEDIEIKPYSRMRSGVIKSFVIVKIPQYNLDNVLCQMVEDYGEDQLINRIKSL